MSTLDDLTRKLGLLQTASIGTAKKWAQRTRALAKQRNTWDQAAMTAATEVFPAEFNPTRYRSEGSIEALVAAIETL
jgi:hypothetical protein